MIRFASYGSAAPASMLKMVHEFLMGEENAEAGGNLVDLREAPAKPCVGTIFQANSSGRFLSPDASFGICGRRTGAS